MSDQDQSGDAELAGVDGGWSSQATFGTGMGVLGGAWVGSGVKAWRSWRGVRGQMHWTDKGVPFEATFNKDGQLVSVHSDSRQDQSLGEPTFGPRSDKAEQLRETLDDFLNSRGGGRVVSRTLAGIRPEVEFDEAKSDFVATGHQIVVETDLADGTHIVEVFDLKGRLLAAEAFDKAETRYVYFDSHTELYEGEDRELHRLYSTSPEFRDRVQFKGLDKADIKRVLEANPDYVEQYPEAKVALAEATRHVDRWNQKASFGKPVDRHGKEPNLQSADLSASQADAFKSTGNPVESIVGDDKPGSSSLSDG